MKSPILNKNKLPQVLYKRFKRKSKMHEQLEIGKIKFEVTPIYVNKVCVHSLFQLKFTQPVYSNPASKKSYSITILYIILAFMGLTTLYLILYQTFQSLGIFSLSDPLIVSLLTPFIFNGTPLLLTPQLTDLIVNSNLLVL